MAEWTWGDLEPLYYGAIVADPPWAFDAWSEKGQDRDAPYDTMTLDEIADLRVADLARSDCLLALWAVDPLLDAAFRVIEAWGFRFVTVGFYWCKTLGSSPRAGSGARPHHPELAELERLFPMKKGYWTRGNPEICLFAVRGQPTRRDAAVRKLVLAPAGAHSAKPEAVQDGIERLVPGPYAELFARRRRPGWDGWGNEYPGQESTTETQRHRGDAG